MQNVGIIFAWERPSKRANKKTHSTTHRHRDERLNSNLTKWLNAKVAPIFALRLRITAFLTFFCLFSFRIYLCCHVFFCSAQFDRAIFYICLCVFFYIPFIVLFVTSQSSTKKKRNKKENVYLLLYRKQHHTPFGEYVS